MFTKLTIAGTIAAGILFAATAHAGSVRAQYPPPQGNCVVTTSATTQATGGSVTVTVTVRDATGNPVANTPVTLAVTKQPGSGATITPASGSTNASGQISGTLNVGNAAGAVEVTATPADTSCRASVVSGQGAVAAEVALPNTGDGASVGGASTAMLALIGALAVGGSLAAAAGLRRNGARD